MNYYPVFADLKGRKVTVVGGGEIAARKIMMLLRANANIFVVSQKINRELSDLVAKNKVVWVAKNYRKKWIKKSFLVVVATNDKLLNKKISIDAEAQHTFVNVVDEQPLCSYIVPAIVDRSPLQIAISSSGSAPVLARMIRQKLETEIPQYYGKMASISGDFRDRIKANKPNVDERRRFWETLFNDSQFHHLLSCKNIKRAKQLMEDTMHSSTEQVGQVALVGAGPGNVDLMTIGGFQAIQMADVVLADALVSNEILDLVRRDAKIIDVGKRGGNKSFPQDEINEKLVFYAKQGLRVVRLKGGDPFIFGRGGEECQTLLAHNISFKVIPGVTAASGATAYAGIPLTHRDFAQSVTFITGHDKQKYEVDWKSLARPNQTLVIYMGAMNAKTISAELIKHGRAKKTPIAIISHGTKANQQTQLGGLDELESLANMAQKPALIVVGEVVKLHSELKWITEKPLHKPWQSVLKKAQQTLIEEKEVSLVS